MVDLIARTPLGGIAPRSIGAVTLSEISHEAITSLAPFRGQEAAVSAALKKRFGAAFPKPGRYTGKAGARALWSGMGQALILGAALEPIPGAAITDQSDAWTCVALDGQGARDVLARLTPLDLRAGVFRTGQAARTEIAHMSGIVLRTGAERYEMMVFRSMAQTLWHDLETAMRMVAGRSGF